MKLFFFFFSLLLSCSIAVQAQDRCYRMYGLKDEETVSFLLHGNKVWGEYTVKADYYDSYTIGYPFHGTKKGNIITVKFITDRPESLSARMRSYSWTMVTTPTRDYLRLQLYGKNYE